MYSDKQAIISELSSTNAKEAIEYSFNDGNGYIYKAGQVSPDESIIVPADPISSEASTFFAGWDLDGDGYPDELPEDGKISKKFNAVAVFYNINAFTTVNDGSIKGWAQQETSIKVESVDYAASPTGKAIKVTKSLHETITAYAKFTLPVTKQPNGIALWMDASDLNGFGMQLFKNWQPKKHAKEGGDYAYFYGEDGSLAMIEGWRAFKVPANFKGWLIFPMSVFTDQRDIVTGDYLRFGIDSNEDGNNNFSGIFYFGEVVYFDCSVDMFMKQIDKRVYGFKDYDGSFISCGIAQDGDQLVVPADPVREGWTFVGWDMV